MGVVDFDPEKWSQANACDAAADVAKVAKVAKLGVEFPQLSQLSQLSQVAQLPESVRLGVDRLQVMRAPRTVRADLWSRVVADAVGLVASGWAAKAIAMAWSPLDLFGAVTDADGDPYSDGLAMWLAGRKLLAIEATLAVVRDGEGHFYYHRREQAGAKLLWNLGR